MKSIPEDIERKLHVVFRHIEESAAFDGICGKNFNEATSVSSLVAASGLSERSLRDYFKAYTGQSLVKYVSSRRAEYAARIFRLFPSVSKSQAAYAIGFNCANGIYGLMRKNGVTDLDSLRGTPVEINKPLSYRKETLNDCVLFYNQSQVEYDGCSNEDFEVENWNAIEKFVKAKFPNSLIVGYVGFAIDRYIENDVESGTFITGLLLQGINVSSLDKDMLGRIGWRIAPPHSYAVFTHIGSYNSLNAFYEEVIATINHNNIDVDIAIPFMEKYLNSPADEPEEELITELWVALDD